MSEAPGPGWIQIAPAASPLATGYRGMFQKHLAWQVRTLDGHLWVRPAPASLKPLFRLHTLVTAGDHDKTARYAILRDYKPPEMPEDYKHPVFDGKSRERSSQLIENENWWRAAKEIQNLLFFCLPEERAEVLRRFVAPRFFARYPSGRIDFFHVDPTYVSQTHILRKLFFMHGVPGVAPEQLLRILPATLTRLLPFSAQYFPKSEIDIIAGLFFPSIYAMAAPQSTSALIFHFGRPQDGSQPFPPSFEHWWRSDDTFQEDGGRADRILAQVAKGIAPGIEPIFPGEWSPGEWNTLFRWYVQRLEELYRLVLDFAAFSDAERRPRYSVQFKTLLTLNHIATETQLVMSTLPGFLRKTLTFDILDQYASLATGGSADSRQTATMFSKLVREDWVLGPLREALELAPEPFSSYFSETALPSVWTSIRSSILQGVFVPQNRPYGPTAETDYVQKVLRAMRNTRHGFFLRPSQFDKVLAIHDGNLSDNLPGLAALFWFALLARPRLFLGNIVRS